MQKLAYDPSNLPIWGIWDAPVKDKNYYFGSFTYKNHWCAYATLGFGILAGLTMHWLRHHPKDLLRGSPVPLALLGMGILALSVPLSASLLGILLMVGVGIPFIGFLCLRLLPRDWGWHRWLVTLSITLFLPLTGIWMVFTSNPDIKNEARHKIIVRWQALKDGHMPWRYHHSKDSLAMFFDKPVFGWGLGSTFPLYPRYVSDEIITQSEGALAFAHHDERFFFAKHSHNDWFQYLAETGVMGVFLLALTPLNALRRFRLSSSLGTWTMLVCGALALFSLVDFPSRTPACLILFAVTYGCSIKYMASRE
jgi:O-antigen ligase